MKAIDSTKTKDAEVKLQVRIHREFRRLRSERKAEQQMGRRGHGEKGNLSIR